MTIKFFNTLTRKKEIFKPLHDKEVLMYSCGPTVYSEPHIGNIRSFIIADLIRRFLEFEGFKVKQIMNITDIDDKTIRDSGKANMSLKEFTDRFIEIFFNQLDKINVKQATAYPKATENIKEMIEVTRELMKKGYAYEKNGSVYFSISKFKNYGKLSHLDMKKIKIGATVAADEYDKENPQDFALMKRSTTEELRRGIYYETEWGNVRPGWHIECSTMVNKYLGQTIDIHTGGVDLIFPHHENEIAQAEAFTGKPFVKYWLHGEHLLVNGKKMAKSIGNVINLNELMKKFSPEVVRYMFVSVHWKQKVNYTDSFANNAEKNYFKLKETFEKLQDAVKHENKKSKDDDVFLKKVADAREKFKVAMEDNLNTPLALSVFHQFAKEINKYSDKNGSKLVMKKALKQFEEFSEVLGLKFESKKEKLTEDIEELIQRREKARNEGNWKTADEIRDELKNKGIILEDTSKGIKWKKIK